MIWLGFVFSLVSLLAISKRSLPLGLIIGAAVLGLFTLTPSLLLDRIIYTITSTNIILLSLAMGLIPLIGGIMKQSGQIDSLIGNIRIGQRAMLGLSPALMGLLPMPGGALLSAPILKQVGEGVPDDITAAVNNWFRHLFILIYPLSPALIASAEIAGLDVYQAMLHLLPVSLFAAGLGYVFFLRKVKGRLPYNDAFSLTGLLIPLFVIISAPALDFILKKTIISGGAATLIGVGTALVLSLIFSPIKINLLSLVRQSKPWNFALIIIGMFLYLHIFQVSGVGSIIAGLPFPPLLLSIIAGFAMGFFTGRVQLPASILFPIYLASIDHVTPLVFVLIYVSIFFGYIISPVHPCLVVTCEYFGVPIKTMLLRLIIPTLLVIVPVILIALIII